MTHSIGFYDLNVFFFLQEFCLIAQTWTLKFKTERVLFEIF